MVIRKNIGFLLICIGLFVTPTAIRTGVLNTQWALINVISWAGVLLLLSRYYRGGKIKLTHKGSPGVSNPIWIVFLAVLFLASCLYNRKMTAISIVKYEYAQILPLVMLFVKVPEQDAKKYFNSFCFFLMGSCTFMVLCGILDLVFHVGIGNSLANLIGNASLYGLLREGRMVSYMGHSLLTSELMLLCFLFNALRRQILGGKEPVWYTVFYTGVCLIGIGLSASKAGLLLLAPSILLLCSTRKGWKNGLIIVAIILLANALGIFDILLERFVRGLTTGDITTGRNTALKRLLESGELEFKFLSGFAGGTLSVSMIAALEYAPLRWAYLFGIWFSIVMCVILFVVPMIQCWKLGGRRTLWAMLIIIVEVNSYNGITTQNDHLLLYCVAIFVLLNIARLEAKR